MSNKPNRQKKSATTPAYLQNPNAVDASVKRNLLWIVIGVAVVAAIAIGVGVILTRGGDDTPEVEYRMPQLDFGDVTITGELLPEVNDQTGVTAAHSIGLPAPVISGTDYFAEPTTIDAATDGPTLVVLLAHWCSVCNAEIPRLNEWRDAGDVPEWLDVIGVGSAVNPDAQHFPAGLWLQRMDWTWPVLADVDFTTDYANSATRALGSGGYPGFVLIDGNGVVVWKHNGAVGIDSLNQVIAAAFPDGAGTDASTDAATTVAGDAATTVDADAADATATPSTGA